MNHEQYESFLESKRIVVPPAGITGDITIHDSLFQFQSAVTRWALRRGRSAVWLDTGLGKSRVAIEWARIVSAHTSKPVVIVTPLAVAQQFVSEGEKIGVPITHIREASDASSGVNVVNYERFDRIDIGSLGGIVLDESSKLADYSSATSASMIELCSLVPFRLCCSATPAPNEPLELGTHAEFLGIMRRTEMLSRWFVHDGETTHSWRLKGHAVDDFWRWVASWAMAARKPSDLGFDCDDSKYALPELRITDVVVDSVSLSQEKGMLFGYEASTLNEQREARKHSLVERVEACRELVSREPDHQWLIWCDLNCESEMLSRIIPGAVEVRGSGMTPEEKESRVAGFISGVTKVLVTKPSICGLGLNMQRCSRTAFVGLSHSWQQWYQAIRRVWRFGQLNAVDCYMISSSAEGRVVDNLKRKQRQADEMIVGMVSHMADTMKKELGMCSRDFTGYEPKEEMMLPIWMRSDRNV